jgi:hypothetical protein
VCGHLRPEKHMLLGREWLSQLNLEPVDWLQVVLLLSLMERHKIHSCMGTCTCKKNNKPSNSHSSKQKINKFQSICSGDVIIEDM